MNYYLLIVPLIITTVILLIIGGYSVHFHAIPAAKPFTLIMFLGAIWASTYALSMVDGSLSDKIFLLKIRISLQLFIPLAMFFTALEHARLTKWLKNWQKPLLFIVPAIILLAVWNDASFPLMFYDIRIPPNSPILSLQFGQLLWLFASHILVLEIWMLAIFLYTLKNSHGIYFRQTLFLTLALSIPEAAYLLFGVLQIGPETYSSIAPNSLLLTGLLSAWALFRYQWLSIAPKARNLAVNGMNDCMIVLDIENHIIDFNQAAKNFFAISDENIGLPIEKSIPQWEKLSSAANENNNINELELELHGDEYHFEITNNQIKDHHNQVMGRVIVLRDFTQRKKDNNELKKHIKELEVINAISVSISSQLDMDKLITLIGQKLEDIFNVHSVFVALYDSPSRLIKIPYWTINNEQIKSAPLKIGESLTSIILQTKQPLLITENFQETSKKLGVTLWLVDQFSSPKTWLGVPVIVGEETIGVIGVQDYEKENAFNQDDTRLLQTIAANLGIAIQNARLYQQAHHRAEQMSTLYNVGLTLTANLEFNQVLYQLFESCQQILPMDAFYVAVYNEKNQTVSHPLYYENGTEKQVPTRDITISPGLSGEIILNGKTIYLADTTKRQIRKSHHIIRAGGKPVRSYIGAPMTVSGRVIGVISIQSYEPNAYSQEQIRLLETIANVAGVAVENSRLFEQAQADIEKRRQAQESLSSANQVLHVQLNKVKAMQRELREQAIRDPLTGLHNRRFLNNLLPQRIEQASQRGTQLSILMIDIDRFKTFNDSYGHHAGDALLQALAGLLRRHIRTLDIACRYGGEEFLLVLSNTSLHKKQIAQFFSNIGRVAGRAHLFNLFLHFFQHTVDLGPIKAHPRGAVLEFLRLDQGWQGWRQTVQHALMPIAVLLALPGLDFFPIRKHIPHTIHAHLAKHMRMPAHNLVINALQHARHAKLSRFGRDLGIQHNLQQQVTKLFAHFLRVLLIQRRQRFIAFFQQMLAQGLVGLLLVPGTAIFRRAQMRNDFLESLKRGAHAQGRDQQRLSALFRQIRQQHLARLAMLIQQPEREIRRIGKRQHPGNPRAPSAFRALQPQHQGRRIRRKSRRVRAVEGRNIQQHQARNAGEFKSR